MDKILEIRKLTKDLPHWVHQDINKRITDWIASGGSPDDPYIDQQLRFAQRFVEQEDNRE